MEETLDRLHAHARALPVLQRLAVIARILLALAFIPTGFVKLMGWRFTAIPVDNPIGLFFETLYQTGLYWNFLGWAQVIGGILLLIPRTTTLGAVLFFPIVLNIFIITVSLGFRGTPFVTGAMLLASVFLLCWDYDRLKSVLWPPASTRSRPPAAPIGRLERSGYALGTIAGLVVFSWTRGLVPIAVMRGFFLLGVLAMLLVLVAWLRAPRRAPS